MVILTILVLPKHVNMDEARRMADEERLGKGNFREIREINEARVAEMGDNVKGEFQCR